MMSKPCWFLILVFSFTIDVFPNAAADRIDSCHRPRPVRSSSRVSERKCEEYTRGTTCKSSYENIDPTVVESAKLGEFPHLAFIATNASHSKDAPFVCTGSLISPRFVLTAAHCTTHPSLQLSYVSLGDHNIDLTVEDGATPVQIPIKAIIRHPEYKPPMKYNDIALLELASEVSFNANIRPACLWTEKQISGHAKAVIATIDRTSDDQLRQRVIQKVFVTVKDNNVCNTKFPTSRSWPHGMDDTQLCGQEATGKNAECKAMGGSPLQIVSNTENSCAFNVVGITSFGFKLCSDYPTVFTRVSSYVDWIESVVWRRE